MNYLFYKFLFALLVVFCFNVNAQDFASITPRKGDKYTWKSEWNIFLADEIRNQKAIFLNDSILPKAQITSLCSGYFNASDDEKIAFWVLVFASIAKFESGFKPAARYQEGPSLNNVFSEGLLQLSYTDQQSHRDLNLSIDRSKGNILDPQANLESGVKILAKQLRRKGVLFTDKSYYWSVLTKKRAEITGFFKRNCTEFNFCR